MRIAFLVNDACEVTPRQTTCLLMRAAAMRGHETWAFGVDDVEVLADAAIHVQARPVSAAPTTAALLVALRASAVRRHRLESFDVLFMRTNPGRDVARAASHECALAVARMAAARGVLVLNHPDGLARAATKLSLFELPPHVRPATYIARSVDALDGMVRVIGGPVVIKPARGTRGQDVFLLTDHDRVNQRQIIDVIRRDGYVMVQEYVAGPQANDQRVVALDGAILEDAGRPAVIARVPRTGDFRSNLHAGAEPVPGVITEGIRSAVSAVSGWLRREGLFFVGLDFIGDRIIEVNALSPGGLWDASRYQDRDFAQVVVRALEARVAEQMGSMRHARAVTG